MPSGAERDWAELAITLRAADEEVAVALLGDLFPAGMRCEGVGPDLVRLIGHVESTRLPSGGAGTWEQRVIEILRPVPVLAFEAKLTEDRDWMAQWRVSWRPVRLCADLWVCAPWHDLPEPGRAIWMEPGAAFGTGHHESTRLAAMLVEEQVRPGGTYLDLGCGTGVLAIAAVLLGAGRVHLNDIDPDARAVAHRELRLNRCEDRARWVDDPRQLAELDGVFMNIDLETIGRLLPAVVPTLGEKGWIAVSGVLRSSSGEVLRAASDADLELRRELAEGEWWSGLLGKVPRP